LLGQFEQTLEVSLTLFIPGVTPQFEVDRIDRIARFLEDVRLILGDRSAVLGREMTKHYEEFLRGPLSELVRELRARTDIKGEITLLVAGCDAARPESAVAVQEAIERGLQEGTQSHSALAREIAATFAVSRREAYERILVQRQRLDPSNKE